MFIFESILAIIAPHVCIECGREGRLLCIGCQRKLDPTIEVCYRCRRISRDGKTCKSCRSSSKLVSVKAFTTYKGTARQLVWKLKFDRARAAGEEIGGMVTGLVKGLPENTIIVHVPTATSRVRKRGYDQSAIIARQLSRRTKLRYAPLLSRRGQHKQVGSTGMQRRKKMDHAFAIRRPMLAKDAHVLLVDDVITTGATLEAAAKTLKYAGAKKVEAIVFARA